MRLLRCLSRELTDCTKRVALRGHLNWGLLMTGLNGLATTTQARAAPDSHRPACPRDARRTPTKRHTATVHKPCRVTVLTLVVSHCDGCGACHRQTAPQELYTNAFLQRLAGNDKGRSRPQAAPATLARARTSYFHEPGLYTWLLSFLEDAVLAHVLGFQKSRGVKLYPKNG